MFFPYHSYSRHKNLDNPILLVAVSTAVSMTLPSLSVGRAKSYCVQETVFNVLEWALNGGSQNILTILRINITMGWTLAAEPELNSQLEWFLSCGNANSVNSFNLVLSANLPLHITGIDLQKVLFQLASSHQLLINNSSGNKKNHRISP